METTCPSSTFLVSVILSPAPGFNIGKVTQELADCTIQLLPNKKKARSLSGLLCLLKGQVDLIPARFLGAGHGLPRLLDQRFDLRRRCDPCCRSDPGADSNIHSIVFKGNARGLNALDDSV